MSTEILKVEGLRAGYGDADILHGIDLAIAEGDFISVIGPNGAGKSTLLKALHGVLAPRAGSVWLSSNGTAVDVAGSKPYRVTGLGMNYVPQLANVFPRLTLAENLEIGGTVVRRELKRHLDRVYGMFPLLYERKKERAGVLSGGQRQMLALARALMTEPRVLLLDEPSAGLAPMMVDEVFGKLAEISGSGVAILMVEQNARRSLAASRYTYVLDMGTNRYEGESQDLMHDPEIVALYLGGAGRLDAPVEETGGGVG